MHQKSSQKKNDAILHVVEISDNRDMISDKLEFVAFALSGDLNNITPPAQSGLISILRAIISQVNHL